MHSYTLMVLKKDSNGFQKQAEIEFSNLLPAQFILHPSAHLEKEHIQILLELGALSVQENTRIRLDLTTFAKVEAGANGDHLLASEPTPSTET